MFEKDDRRKFLEKTLAVGAAVGLAGLAAVPAQAADVGVSIGFSQPGVYGRVDIGRYPQPMLIAPQPVYVGRPVYREPVYLWVPPGHQKNWRKHCHRYQACGVPVYFVQEGWYREHVMVAEPAREHHPGKGHGKGRGKGHD